MDQLLEEYYHTKEKIKDLEDILVQYKNRIEDEMDDTNNEYIETRDYLVERKKMSTETLKKADCPREVWNEYATRHTFNALYIKKKGERRRRSRSRSPRRKLSK